MKPEDCEQQGGVYYNRSQGSPIPPWCAWPTWTTAVHCNAGTGLTISYPYPGNEALVNRHLDNLFNAGQVVYDKLAQVHVHGLADR
jgi:hypothetical protein